MRSGEPGPARSHPVPSAISGTPRRLRSKRWGLIEPVDGFRASGMELGAKAGGRRRLSWVRRFWRPAAAATEIRIKLVSPGDFVG
jgi:hypothetical protein